MSRHIAFLHTSPDHVETFERLVRAADPGLHVEHLVAEDLLAEAQRVGASDPTVVRRVHEAMTRAAAHGAAIVVCTCSTIGAAAEHTPRDRRFAVARIDRAMADRAVALGPTILVAAALDSTLAPTQALVLASAARMGVAVAIQPLLVPGAWPHFLGGERQAYLDAIAAAVRVAVRAAAEPVDVVVLAQASMAPAAELLRDLGVEVLSSPALGVQSALATLHGDDAWCASA